MSFKLSWGLVPMDNLHGNQISHMRANDKEAINKLLFEIWISLKGIMTFLWFLDNSLHLLSMELNWWKFENLYFKLQGISKMQFCQRLFVTCILISSCVVSQITCKLVFG